MSETVWMSPAVTTPGPLLAHDHALGALAVHAEGDFLDVEHDVGDVLAHAGDRREFVQHAVDLHRRHRRALQRRQQHAAQRIAERQAEAALERLGDHGGEATRVAAGGDLELVRLDQLLPVFLDGHEPVLSKPDRRMWPCGRTAGLTPAAKNPLLLAPS